MVISQDYHKAYQGKKLFYQSNGTGLPGSHQRETQVDRYPQGPFQYSNIPQIQKFASRIGLDLMGYGLSLVILRPISLQKRKEIYKEFLNLLDQMGIKDQDHVVDWMITKNTPTHLLSGTGIQDQGTRYIQQLEMISPQGVQLGVVSKGLVLEFGTPSMWDL